MPPPRLHMVRYHGVLSSHAKARSEVVPMRWLEAATTPDAIARLLAKHGLGPRLPPKRPLLGQLWLAFPNT